MSNFAPALNLDGHTVLPRGYEWVMGFALGGCDWAIEEISKPEFLEMVRADLERKKIANLEAELEQYKKKIVEIENELHSYT